MTLDSLAKPHGPCPGAMVIYFKCPAGDEDEIPLVPVHFKAARRGSGARRGGEARPRSNRLDNIERARDTVADNITGFTTSSSGRDAS